jgi:hypothetical protein
LVEVTIQVTTPDDLYDVVVEDWVAGCIEPLDPRLQVVGDSVGFVIDYNEIGYGLMDIWMFWGWWSPFPTPEVTTDHVRWTANYLSAGSHSVTYQAVAVTTGVFVLPPTKAYVVKQPELMGLSYAGSFLVSEEYVQPSDVNTYITSHGATLNQQVTPVECKNGCGPDSQCNLKTGTCDCVSAACTVWSSTSCPNGDCSSTKLTSKAKRNIIYASVGVSLCVPISAGMCLYYRRKNKPPHRTSQGGMERVSTAQSTTSGEPTDDSVAIMTANT